MKSRLAPHRRPLVRILLSLAALVASSAMPAFAQNEIVLDIPVTFTVRNTNPTQTPCATDRKTYEIKGHIVGPDPLVRSSEPVPMTLYTHGIGWGEFYWHMTTKPAYDYAGQMGHLGHVSVVYDQLGYGASGRPSGLLNCYGGEASIAHQIADALRSGNYTATGSPVIRASKVALASNQAAALVSQPAASTYRDFDALIVTSFSDFPAAFKPAFLTLSAPVFALCTAGGQRSDGDHGPYFYSPFPFTDDAFKRANFADADPDVVDEALRLRQRASCGEPFSAVTTVSIDNLQRALRTITVPVLLVNGLQDAFFMQPFGGVTQANLYKGSGDVTTRFVAGAGQALTLERSAPDFRQIMHTWLAQRGF